MKLDDISKQSIENIKEVDDFLKNTDSQYNTNDLKEDVNNFLYNKVDGGLTIMEFEKISIAIHDFIYDKIKQEG